MCAPFSKGRAVCLAVLNMEGEEFGFRIIEGDRAESCVRSLQS